MTYFFYIITLILSSSCILIGVGLILRRVLLHRSARDGYAGTSPWSRRRHNQFATSTTGGTTNQGFVGPPPPDGLWTMPYPNHAMVYPPPSYDRINESVVPPHAINVPPPYDAAAMILGQKKEEEVIMNMTELTNRVDTNNNTSATVNQTESTNNPTNPVQDNTSEQSDINNNNNNTGNQIA